MSRKIILIIDDHKNFREMTRSFVEKKFPDVDVQEAATGEEGFKLAVKERPDVSLIDVRLPGIDGIEVAERIKRQVPGCRVITMSMFKQSSLKDLIKQKVIVFVNKDEIDSELFPLLHKILTGQKN